LATAFSRDRLPREYLLPHAPGWLEDVTGVKVTDGAAGVVTVSTANVRSGPSTSYPIITQKHAGNLVELNGRNSANDWLRIVLGSGHGWMHSSLLAANIITGYLPVVGSEPPPPPPEPGNALIGIHASADSVITAEEIADIGALQPGVIKVLSSTAPDGIGQLRENHPNAVWIVRAFLAFLDGQGNPRNISPQQFLDWTLPDVQRTLNWLPGKTAVIELHNEPNLVDEGLGGAWNNGTEFGQWLDQVRQLYRNALPGVPLMYPGLVARRPCARYPLRFPPVFRGIAWGGAELRRGGRTLLLGAADWLLDGWCAELARPRHRPAGGKPIWITEASNNRGGITPDEKAAAVCGVLAGLPGAVCGSWCDLLR
jgi:hypothetical protein